MEKFINNRFLGKLIKMAPIYEIPSKDSERAEKLLELAGIQYSLRKDNKQIVETDSRDYIVMPADFVDGKYGQSDLRISPARVSDSPAIREVGKTLGLKLRNTAKDSLRRGFVGNINWEEAMKINTLSGKSSLSLDTAADFANLLYQGMNGNIDVYDARGSKLSNDYLQGVFEDMFAVKSPWRSEWFDASFKFRDGKLYLEKNHVMEGENLVPGSTEVLSWGLRQSKTPGIDLASWISNPTKQGFPRKDVKEGSLYYWAPMKDNNSVAGFIADSDRVDLVCNWDPSYRNSDLGVRAVRHE